MFTPASGGERVRNAFNCGLKLLLNHAPEMSLLGRSSAHHCAPIAKNWLSKKANSKSRIKAETPGKDPSVSPWRYQDHSSGYSE
jgi:hypothetical protein